MNYPRVNLLKKSERRYQGAVSRRFTLISIVITPLLFLAVISGVTLIQYGGMRSELKTNHEIWRALEPKLATALEQQRELKTNREALILMDAWQESKVSIEELLEAVQEVIPENIQLKRISIRSDLSTSIYRHVDDLALDFRLVLSGVAQGSQAEDSVIRLRRDLLGKERLSSIFRSITLTSMRKHSGADGENIREFNLKGISTEGEEEQ